MYLDGGTVVCNVAGVSIREGGELDGKTFFFVSLMGYGGLAA